MRRTVYLTVVYICKDQYKIIEHQKQLLAWHQWNYWKKRTCTLNRDFDRGEKKRRQLAIFWLINPDNCAPPPPMSGERNTFLSNMLIGSNACSKPSSVILKDNLSLSVPAPIRARSSVRYTGICQGRKRNKNHSMYKILELQSLSIVLLHTGKPEENLKSKKLKTI